jgi:competence protein ComEC
LSIALLMPPLEQFRDWLLRTDPLLPRKLLPRWQRWTYPVLRVVLTWLTVSLAAWLGSWPLCAYYFHIFSPVTLLANLLVVPLSGCALASNLGSLVCGDWLPWPGELFNHSGWLWMKWMVDISHTLVKWPHAYFYVRGPAATDFVIYYSALIAVLSGVAFKKQWRMATMLGAMAVMAFYGWRWHEGRQTTTLTVLPLNGGHAVFVQGGKASDRLLVDCGDTNSVDFITEPFLHAQGVNQLPQLALTQGDLRDMGGAMRIGDRFAVDHVITSPTRFRSRTYRQAIVAMEETPGKHQVVSHGDTLGAWRVLYPAATNNFPQADDNALVLLGQIHGLKILLLSDLGRIGQEFLLNQTNDLQADLVIAGLPEQSQPLSDGLLKQIQPKIIVIADALFPATKRAPAALRERLAQHYLPVLYTRQTGAVTVVVKPDGWELRTMDGQKFEGR